MTSYIFVSPGSDPGFGRPLTDPSLRSGTRATMGTCRPDLRRYVRPGDQIFVISGSMGKQVKQYVIGALQVDSILDSQLAAYEQFPEHRLRYNEAGQRIGNIIVTSEGDHDPRDHHDKFEKRIKNYLIGTPDPVVLETDREVELGRMRTIDILSEVFDKPRAISVREIIGRNRRLDDRQADHLRRALLDLKRSAGS